MPSFQYLSLQYIKSNQTFNNSCRQKSIKSKLPNHKYQKLESNTLNVIYVCKKIISCWINIIHNTIWKTYFTAIQKVFQKPCLDMWIKAKLAEKVSTVRQSNLSSFSEVVVHLVCQIFTFIDRATFNRAISTADYDTSNQWLKTTKINY